MIFSGIHIFVFMTERQAMRHDDTRGLVSQSASELLRSLRPGVYKTQPTATCLPPGVGQDGSGFEAAGLKHDQRLDVK